MALSTNINKRDVLINSGKSDKNVFHITLIIYPIAVYSGNEF